MRGYYWSWLQLNYSLKLVTRCGHIGASICAKMLMVFSAMSTIHEGPKLDAQMSQIVMSTNCQYNIICQHK